MIKTCTDMRWLSVLTAAIILTGPVGIAEGEDAKEYDRDPKKPETESTPKGFLVFRITDDELQMGHHTADGWLDRWSTPLKAAQVPANLDPVKN